MADRRVKVRVTADVNDYLRETRRAERETDAFGRQVEESTRQAKRGHEGLTEATKDTTKATGDLTKANRRLEDANAKVAIAQARLNEVQKTAARDSSRFLSAQDQVRRALREREDATRDVNTVTHKMARTARDATGEVSLVSEGLRRFGTGAVSKGPVVIGAAAAALALVGPAAGAATAGLGGAAGALGVAAAAYHGFKEEIAAGTDLGQEVQSQIDAILTQVDRLSRIAATEAGADVTAALGEVEDYLFSLDGPVRVLAGHLGDAFSIGTSGLIDGLKTLQPLLEDGGKYAEQFAQEFADFMRSEEFSDFVDYARRELPEVLELMESLTKAGIALGKALAPVGDDLITVISGAANVIDKGSDAISFMGKVASHTPGALQLASGAINVFSEDADEAATKTSRMDTQLQGFKTSLRESSDEALKALPKVDAFGNELRDAEGDAIGADRALDNLVNSILGIGSAATDASNAEINFQATIDRATKTIKENGKTLDLNTQKGRENQKIINDLRDAGIRRVATLVAEGASQRKVNRAFEGARTAYIDAQVAAGHTRIEARKLADQAGYTQQNIDKVAESLRRIPKDTKAKVSADTAQARREIDAVADALAAIDRSITVNVKTVRQYGGGTLRFMREGMSTGGPVIGPGTGTSDSVPRDLSNGEHVWTAAEVAAAGGHAGVMALRKGVLSGAVAPNFAAHRVQPSRPITGGSSSTTYKQPVYVDKLYSSDVADFRHQAAKERRLQALGSLG